MTDANEYIFSSLVKYVEKSEINETIPEGTRYIKTDEVDKKWLKQLKVIKKQPILPNLTTAFITFEQQEYFLIIGWNKSVNVDAVITPIPLNAGLVTALLFELKINIRQEVSPYIIVEQVLFQNEEEAYLGHDFVEVSAFFEPILVYKILEDSPLKGQELERLSGFYLSKNSQKLLLQFSAETILTYEKLFLEGNENIPYENLLLSLTSVYWKYSFLDVYRCIEGIFSISRVDELCEKLCISIPLRQFSTEIENSLGWRPKEEDTLSKLIEKSPTDATLLFREVKKVIDGKESGNIGLCFYKIRNSIVHFRHQQDQSATQESRLNGKDWDKLIRGALLVIKHWYEEYGSKLN